MGSMLWTGPRRVVSLFLFNVLLARCIASQIVIRYTAMRYVTAFLGGLFMFVAVFILSSILIAFLPPVFRTSVSLGGVHTNNVFGLILGSLAATASFRSTILRARAKDAAKAARRSDTV